MSIIYEAHRSPDVTVADDGKGGSASITYVILETANSSLASALARASAPLAVATATQMLIRNKIKLSPTGVDSWEAVADYVPEDSKEAEQKPEPGMWKFSFSTTGARHTITTAPMVSRHWYTSADEAPDLKGAINYDGQEVRGVEILVPSLRFDITAYYEPTDVTPAFMREISRKTARTNTDTWLGFEPGELLYGGGDGSGDIPLTSGQRVQPISVVHHFEASENRLDIPIGNIALGDPQAEINKKGHEYLWVRFKTGDDSGRVVKVPNHAYVHKPYEELNYADFFGFGGP